MWVQTMQWNIITWNNEAYCLLDVHFTSMQHVPNDSVDIDTLPTTWFRSPAAYIFSVYLAAAE